MSVIVKSLSFANSENGGGVFDLSVVTATGADVLSGKKILDSSGLLVEGTIINRGTNLNKTITQRDTPVSLSEGFYGGTTTIGLSTTDKTNLIPENIKKDVTILGITGTMPSGLGLNKVVSGTITSSLGNIIISDLDSFVKIQRFILDCQECKPSKEFVYGFSISDMELTAGNSVTIPCVVGDDNAYDGYEYSQATFTVSFDGSSLTITPPTGYTMGISHYLIVGK